MIFSYTDGQMDRHTNYMQNESWIKSLLCKNYVATFCTTGYSNNCQDKQTNLLDLLHHCAQDQFQMNVDQVESNLPILS